MIERLTPGELAALERRAARTEDLEELRAILDLALDELEARINDPNYPPAGKAEILRRMRAWRMTRRRRR